MEYITAKNLLVSIIVPTHNRASLLPRAIESLLNQTYQNIQIIVVDDGSSDNTQQLFSDYNDQRIKFIRNDQQQGACKARNQGIELAEGELVTFLDDDDEFLPERISRMLDIYNDKWAYIATGLYYINKGNVWEKRIPKKVITLDDMLFKVTIGNSILVSRSKLVELGGFDESLTSAQDYDLWLRLNISYGDAACVPEPLYIMHTEHLLPRITSSHKKISGQFRFYQKHRARMNRDQRAYKLFELLRYRRRKLGIRQLVKLVPLRFTPEAVTYYMMIKYPELRQWYFYLQKLLHH